MAVSSSPEDMPSESKILLELLTSVPSGKIRNFQDQGLPRRAPHYTHICQGPPVQVGTPSPPDSSNSEYAHLCIIPSHSQAHPEAREDSSQAAESESEEETALLQQGDR